jgi:hypothetical protein
MWSSPTCWWLRQLRNQTSPCSLGVGMANHLTSTSAFGISLAVWATKSTHSVWTHSTLSLSWAQWITCAQCVQSCWRNTTPAGVVQLLCAFSSWWPLHQDGCCWGAVLHTTQPPCWVTHLGSNSASHWGLQPQCHDEVLLLRLHKWQCNLKVTHAI